MAKKVVKKVASKKVEDKYVPTVGTKLTTDALARAIAEKSVVDCKQKFSIADAMFFLSLFKDAIEDALKKGQKVQLTGFFSITPSYRNEREGNNVCTGEKMTIPASVSFNAKAGKRVKDLADELAPEVVEAIKNLKK